MKNKFTPKVSWHHLCDNHKFLCFFIHFIWTICILLFLLGTRADFMRSLLLLCIHTEYMGKLLTWTACVFKEAVHIWRHEIYLNFWDSIALGVKQSRTFNFSVPPLPQMSWHHFWTAPNTKHSCKASESFFSIKISEPKNRIFLFLKSRRISEDFDAHLFGHLNSMASYSDLCFVRTSFMGT